MNNTHKKSANQIHSKIDYCVFLNVISELIPVAGHQNSINIFAL